MDSERKRKRDTAGDNDDASSDPDAEGREKPKEGLKAPPTKKPKKSKDEKKSKDDGGKDETNAAEDDEKKREKAERLKQKKKEKKEILARRREKHEKKKERKILNQAKRDAESREDDSDPEKAAEDASIEPQGDEVPTVEFDEDDDNPDGNDEISFSGFTDGDKDAEESSAAATPNLGSPFSEAEPSTSSTSSIVPPSTVEESSKPSLTPINTKSVAAESSAHQRRSSEDSAISLKLPHIDKDILKARLTAKIEALREARAADGLDGKPARSRQELLDARRKKEENRKARKKEQRKQDKEAEKVAAEEELARLRGSGSPLTASDIFSPSKEMPENSFSFGRVTFDDGMEMDPSLEKSRMKNTKKGPTDPKTALEMAKRRQANLSNISDADKKAKAESKDAWFAAKQKAQGEKVKDNVSLLQKTLKRKEREKGKSEKQWNERIEGVKKGIEIRQKKREDNLRKRKEEKGSKKGKKNKGVKSKGKGRPGFEGRN